MTTGTDSGDGSPLSSFQMLLGDFLTAAGHPEASASETEGVEFVSDDFIVRVYPHPVDDRSAVLDVKAYELEPDEAEADAQRMVALHRLNEAGRLDHGWIALVTPDDILLLSRTLRISETDGAQLAAFVADGLDRAESLARDWISLGQVPAPQPEEEDRASFPI